eukprot:NODE_601_length_5514_cov_0.613481.p1 type:complete len:810 gc:universal NODE_601_length_5514_cov_0.613481:3217-788(-)
MTSKSFLGKNYTKVFLGTCKSNFTRNCEVVLRLEYLNDEIYPSVYYMRKFKATKKKPECFVEEKVGQLEDKYIRLVGELMKDDPKISCKAYLKGFVHNHYIDIELQIYGADKQKAKLEKLGIKLSQSEEEYPENSERGIRKKIKKVHFDFDKFWKEFKVDNDYAHKYRKEPSPLNLKSKLLPHQQQALAWMFDCENPKAALDADPSRIMQFYKKIDDDTYINVLTRKATTSPNFTQSMIVADDMGLGKTIQTIALILKDKETNPNWYKSGPTLIVCPKTLIDNWSEQIDEHCMPNSLSYMVLYGESAKFNPSLEHRDVVITTYERVQQRPQYFSQWNFRRCILDEAHKIRNAGKSYFESVSKIQADCYIALTGTPINNYLSDLRALTTFIRAHYLENADNFKNHIGVNEIISPQKCNLFSQCYILRRTKETLIDGKPIVALPPKTIVTNRISLSGNELKTYKEILTSYLDLKNKINFYKNHGWMLLLALRLRQCCNHYTLSNKDRVCTLIKIFQQPIPTSDELWISNYKNALIFFLDLNSNGFCPQCSREFNPEPCICYYCKSIFCTKCSFVKLDGEKRCLSCKEPADHLLMPEEYVPDDFLFEDLNNNNLEDGNSQASTVDLSDLPDSEKVRSVLNLIRTDVGENKCVLFSQWKSMLDIYEYHLNEKGYKTVMLHGQLSKEERATQIELFKSTSNNYQIMLITLGLGTGLNLTCANFVIIADLWYNPFVCDQAVDRCYRIGQTKPVFVYYFICSNSIEDDVELKTIEKRGMASQVISTSEFIKIEINYSAILEREFDRLKNLGNAQWD